MTSTSEEIGSVVVGSDAVIAPIVPTWRASAGGSSGSILASARAAVSSPPGTDPDAAARRLPATATASSRSSMSGGIARPPAPRR
ncbi:MAG: hypothetical protein WKF58_05325 [Ilumatobacteraceae bacterium]